MLSGQPLERSTFVTPPRACVDLRLLRRPPDSQGSVDEFWWTGLGNGRHSVFRRFNHCRRHQVLGQHLQGLCDKPCDHPDIPHYYVSN